jgi:hypothetical protein
MSRPPSRAVRPGRQRTRQRRSPTPFIALIVLVLVALGAGAYFFVLRDDDGSGGGDGSSAGGSVDVELGEVTNENAGFSAELSSDAQQQILDQVARYVNRGLVTPVVKGEPVSDRVLKLFDAAAALQAAGADRGVVFDEGVGPSEGDFEPTAAPIALTALSDEAGTFILVTATLVYSGDVETAAGPVKIGRVAELTFAPDGNTWTITGYDMNVKRDAGGTTSTTAAVAP